MHKLAPYISILQYHTEHSCMFWSAMVQHHGVKPN